MSHVVLLAEDRILRNCETCTKRLDSESDPDGWCSEMQIPCEDVAMGLVEHGGLRAECYRYEWNRMVKL